MPHTRNAKKRLRQNKKRRAHNRAWKSSVKTQMKHVLSALEDAEATPEEIRGELNYAYQKIDQAAAKRIIHPNTAARRKSQLGKLVYAHQQKEKSKESGESPD